MKFNRETSSSKVNSRCETSEQRVISGELTKFGDCLGSLLAKASNSQLFILCLYPSRGCHDNIWMIPSN